ncbi:MAG TPA: dihydrodipicolinate synthase family protein [Paenibacillus sp.]|nr:dihydrodipicolinate synthase family protein [Paenibacillus sp.]
MATKKRFPSTILPTAVVPWTETLEFDEAVFRKQVRHFVAEGITHLYLFGTAGEGHAVTDEQYRDIVEVFVEEMAAPGLHPMVGLLSFSQPQMEKRLRIAYELGVRDYQFVLPSWGALNTKEVFDFFHQLCDPYPDCRFLHYNLMRAKRLVTPEEYAALAEDIPNFVGAKFTTMDILTIHKIVSDESPLQFFLGELGYAYGSRLGECGLLSSISNINMERAWDFFRAAKRGDHVAVTAYTSEFASLLGIIMEHLTTERMDGAYDKALAKLIDPAFPLRLLPPYQTATEEQFAALVAGVASRLPQWRKVYA